MASKTTTTEAETDAEDIYVREYRRLQSMTIRRSIVSVSVSKRVTSECRKTWNTEMIDCLLCMIWNINNISKPYNSFANIN